MNIVSRRNMLALPVERLVGNSHNNHHHSSSRSRLSLSPDSDSSISGDSISSDSRSVKNVNSHESHKSHQMKGHHGDILQNNISMSPPPRPSLRETCNNSSNNNYSLSPTNCKTHHNPPSTKESNPNNNDDDSDDSNEDDYHKIRTMNNTTSTKDPYYRSTATTTTSHINSRSKSPKTNKNIKNSERTCCNSPAEEIEEVAEGEMRNSNTMNTNANTDITIVKSEVDTDDRFPKEPSNNTSTLILRDIEEEPIHIDDREEDEGNNNKNSKSRSDKFNEEMSANVNNKNSTKEEDDDEVQVDDNDSEDDTNNRVTSSKVDNSWTSGPRSNSPCYIRRDHRVSRNNNEDNERTEGTNNSSFDNEDPQYRHNHIHNHHHVNNLYHNNSDNTSVGRPPSRPSSSTSSTSSNSFNHKSPLKQQHNNNSNSNFLKFSIADILRPDFGINNTPTSAAVNKLQSPRINGQVFNPFFNITSSESRFHHQKYVNTNATIIAKSELPSPSLSSSSVLSLKNLSKPRNGSVSSTDGGHRPYRPSSVHCHSEDSNSSSISRLREEVVDDTKVNPPVPKGPLVWPAWVYCTRYSDRPSSGPRSRRIRKNPKDVPDEKRPRTAFTGEQLSRLKQEFDENRYLTEKRRQDLARDLKLHENQIKIWFQNKRAKLKKSTGTKNGLAQQLMAQGLYNHSTVPIDEDDEMEMGSMMGMGMHMMQ